MVSLFFIKSYDYRQLLALLVAQRCSDLLNLQLFGIVTHLLTNKRKVNPMKNEEKNQLKLYNQLKLLGFRGIHHPVIGKLIVFSLLFLSLAVLDLSLGSPRLRSKNNELVSSLITNDSEFESDTLPEKEKKITRWWDEAHLSLYEENMLQTIIDRKYTSKLALKATRRARRLNSKGNCLRAVKFSLLEVLKELNNETTFLNPDLLSCDPGRHPYSYHAAVSAEHFRKWAEDNPLSLFKELHLADVSHVPGIKIEEGFILVYEKSQYGFHHRYGHIEVVTNTRPLTACSDHCRKIKTYRKPSLILAPVKNYAPLYTFNDTSRKLNSKHSS